MNYRFRLLCVTVSLGVIAAQVQAASFRGLGNLPDWLQGIPYDVSGDGSLVVGGSVSYNNGTFTFGGFRWEKGTMSSLSDLPGGSNYASAEGVSADASVIVGYSEGTKGVEAVIWNNGTITGLGDLRDLTTYVQSTARAISADGITVVGGSRSDDFYEQAFIWTETNGMTSLGGWAGDSIAYAVSADGSVIVGSIDLFLEKEAVLWQDGTMVRLGDLPGGDFFSEAYAVSADGTTVVGRSKSGANEHSDIYEAFMWKTGVMTPMGDGGSSEAHDVSADGSVIVGDSAAVGAFIWDAVNGMRSIQEVLTKEYGIDLAGWNLISASVIADDGYTIVGTGDNPDGIRESWIATIPEPSGTDVPTVSEWGMVATLLLLLTAGTVELFYRRQRSV